MITDMKALSKKKRTVLAALKIAQRVISTELYNPSDLTEQMVDQFGVDKDQVDKELRVIMTYLFQREMRNKRAISLAEKK